MKKILCLSLASALFVGCATTKKEAPAAPADGKAAVGGKAVAAPADDLDTYATVAQVPDPLQPVNRVTFWINHQVYRYVLKPVAIGYKFIIPEKGREAIGNAFENVKYPVRLANNLLQADLPGAGKQTGAFLVNSTVGIGGLGRRPSTSRPWPTCLRRTRPDLCQVGRPELLLSGAAADRPDHPSRRRGPGG